MRFPSLGSDTRPGKVVDERVISFEVAVIDRDTALDEWLSRRSRGVVQRLGECSLEKNSFPPTPVSRLRPIQRKGGDIHNKRSSRLARKIFKNEYKLSIFGFVILVFGCERRRQQIPRRLGER